MQPQGDSLAIGILLKNPNSHPISMSSSPPSTFLHLRALYVQENQSTYCALHTQTRSGVQAM
jgi:hypothetical protein